APPGAPTFFRGLAVGAPLAEVAGLLRSTSPLGKQNREAPPWASRVISVHGCSPAAAVAPAAAAAVLVPHAQEPAAAAAAVLAAAVAATRAAVPAAGAPRVAAARVAAAPVAPTLVAEPGDVTRGAHRHHQHHAVHLKLPPN